MSALGRPWLHLRSTGSTNARARELAEAGAPHGTLVTADEQTAGRGRQGRTWTAPPGRALLMSLLLRDPPPLLPILAGAAVCEAIGPEARLKWPNDVLLGGGKVAGLLVEGRPQAGWAVLGIGVNVALAPEDLVPGAATLGLTPAAIDGVRDAVLDALARTLQGDATTALAQWRRRDALAGQPVVWADARGRASGIDDAGRLLVVTDDGDRLALDAGEVHLARE